MDTDRCTSDKLRPKSSATRFSSVTCPRFSAPYFGPNHGVERPAPAGYVSPRPGLAIAPATSCLTGRDNGIFNFFKWGTEELYVIRIYDLGFFVKCNLMLGFYLPRSPDRWTHLVRNHVKLLNKHSQCYLSQLDLKSGIYVSKNLKMVAS
jgi:hypothetical protein